MIRDIQDLFADIVIAGTTGSNFAKIEYGYLGEINNIRGLGQYDCIMYLLPPSSVMPDIYKNDEEVSCTFHCYTRFADAVTPASNSSELLQKTHDKLKGNFLNTMANLTRDKEHKYIISGGLNMERTSREFNQEYVGLICTINIRMFSTCVSYSLNTDI